MSLPTERRRALRQRLQDPEPVVAPGVYDCLTARLAEQAGFDTVIVTGAGLVASTLGVPDVGLATMSEVLGQTRNIVNSVQTPVVADCDTGYGNPVNVLRTVREFEAAGVAALFIEDQVTPKRCGHFEGKQIVPTDDMTQKIRAAVDARLDSELVIIARTDARAVIGIEEAVDRGRRFAEAGADMLFVEAPQSEEELAYVGAELSSTRPLMVNLVEGGRTPLVPVDRLADYGFRFVSYSGSMQKTAIKAMQGFLHSLRAEGDVGAYYPSQMVSLDERSEILGLPRFLELGRQYARG